VSSRQKTHGDTVSYDTGARCDKNLAQRTVEAMTTNTWDNIGDGLACYLQETHGCRLVVIWKKSNC
jgi:hypothetical protein